MKTTCPACGSDALSKSTKEVNIPIEFGRDISVEETIYICKVCGTDGDFADENDKIIGDALEVAKKQTTDLILENLSNKGVSMAYFERAMGLPARTLARWKQGKVSASGFALIKIIDTYPWILEVADERFEDVFAVKKMIEKASEALHMVMTPHVISGTQSIISNGDTATVTTSVTLNANANFIINSKVGQIICR